MALQIVFITNNYRPYSGGVVSSIDAAVSGLRSLGHEVTIITLDFTGTGADEPGVIRLSCPIRFLYKNNPMAIPWRMYHQLAEVLDRLKPDIVHVHHPFFLGVAGLELAKERGIPVVFTYHTRYDLYAHYVPLPEELTQPVIQTLVNSFCKKVDGIIAPSISLKNFLLEQGIRTPITIIPSSIDRRYFEPHEKNIHTPLRLLCVARWTPEKNIPFLFDALAYLPPHEVTLTLVGYGNQKDTLIDEVKHRQLHNVIFIEQPTKDILLKTYQDADIFLFASTTETQGIVLAEAMATSNPVIACKATGAEDIIEDGSNGYLINSPEEMAAKIKEFMGNPELLQNLQRQAQKTAEGYRSSSMAQKLIDCYVILISRADHPQ